MIKPFKNYLLLLLTLVLLTSCGDLNKEVESKYKELNNRAMSIDSLLDKEVDKILILDSLIEKESHKIEKLDSLIDKTSSKFDSISKQKIKSLERILNN